MRRVIVVLGPTATGKSKVAIELAKHYNGEIISADSMQIYDKMRIGTARLTEDEMCGIPHHMLAIVEPGTTYTVAEYQTEVKKIIRQIMSRRHTPIIAGGTGLYINAITHDLDFSDTPGNPKLRQQLSDEYDEKGAEKMHEKLRALDPCAANRIHPNDKKRLIRQLEVLQNRKKRIDYNFNRYCKEFDCILIGLTLDRNTLYAHINSRVDRMFEDGLEAEARSIYDEYGSDNTAFLAIGYKEFLPYFNGEQSLEETKELIKQRTRNYAKRQETWFKRDDRIRWFKANEKNITEDIENFIEETINQK